MCILKFSGWLPSGWDHNSLHSHFLLKSKRPNNILITSSASGFIKRFSYSVFETILSGAQRSYEHPLVIDRTWRLREFALHVKDPQLQVMGVWGG